MCDDVCERLASDWPTHTYIHIQTQAKITGRRCIPKIWEVNCNWSVILLFHYFSLKLKEYLSTLGPSHTGLETSD